MVLNSDFDTRFLSGTALVMNERKFDESHFVLTKNRLLLVKSMYATRKKIAFCRDVFGFILILLQEMAYGIIFVTKK